MSHASPVITKKAEIAINFLISRGESITNYVLMDFIKIHQRFK